MKHHRSKKGFSLIELLVVIGIILIVASVIIVGGGGGGGASLSSSQRIVGGIVSGARGQAILKGATARLIIHNDPDEVDRYRRFFGIIYDQSDDPSTTEWVAATSGTYLPEGTYFDAVTSASQQGSSWSEINEMNIDYPLTRPQDGSSGTPYYYYEFKSSGTTTDPNAWLVLRAGTMIPTGDGSSVDIIQVEEVESALKAALIIRRTGSVTLVQEPDVIDESNSGEIE
ncbi:MAG: prepilin-type N-terminal cleavage/methylation domain-containing protein [Verrucomicrobiota bacterium]